MPRGPPRTAAPEVGRGLEGVADRRWRMRRVVRVVICSSDPPRWGCEVTVTHLVTVRGRLTANCEVVSSLLSGRQGITGSTSSPRTKEHSMSQGPIGQHRLAIDVRDDVRGDLADVLHDMHLWVPGADYFGPVWVEGVGWVVPQGWEAPHGWASPPGWHQPAYWDHDDYREWCNNHYSSDHDWRGWESSYHWGEHNQWHGWNDHDHRAWNDHDDGDRARHDHDDDDRAQSDHAHHDLPWHATHRSSHPWHDRDNRAWNDHDGDDRARNDHDHRACNDH